MRRKANDYSEYLDKVSDVSVEFADFIVTSPGVGVKYGCLSASAALGRLC